MMQLDVDTRDLSEEFNLTQSDVQGLLSYTVEEISSQFARQWELQAKRQLKSTRNIYINAIQIRKVNASTVSVYLNPASWLANAIEMGANGYDMKQGLLSSSKVKYTSKGNPYITVPFRFATPGSLGESEAFSGVLPPQIHKKSKNNGRRSLKLSQIPSQYQIPKSSTLRTQFKNNNFKNITNKTKMTSIYEGLSKRAGGYMTFRRVSLSSDKGSWIHPGFDRKDFATKALNQLDIPQIADIAIDNYLDKIL